MVVGDSLPSPLMPPSQPPQQRLVEGDNDIEVLHIQPPVLPPMPGLPAQPPPPGGREVEGESRPPPGPASGSQSNYGQQFRMQLQVFHSHSDLQLSPGD